jgi:hypothetical protein
LRLRSEHSGSLRDEQIRLPLHPFLEAAVLSLPGLGVFLLQGITVGLVSRDDVLEGSRAYFCAYFFGLVLPLLGFGFGRGKELAGLDFRFQDLPRGYGIGYCAGVQANLASPTADLDLLPE